MSGRRVSIGADLLWGGFYKPLPLQGNWFGMALNVVGHEWKWDQRPTDKQRRGETRGKKQNKKTNKTLGKTDNHVTKLVKPNPFAILELHSPIHDYTVSL